VFVIFTAAFSQIALKQNTDQNRFYALS